ncbi:MAG TPA: hypothetical protein PKD92_06305 [Novosphingobium sp.]|nr:hypothetical protein [Novosphingobium sp.]HMP56163.1 hypothetical protein [Novosphingobium sp.]
MSHHIAKGLPGKAKWCRAVAPAETHVLPFHRVDMGAGDRDSCIAKR